MDRKEKLLRGGLVGFGFAGKVFHAPFLATSPDVQFTAIVSSQAPESIPYKNGVVRVFPSLTALLATSPLPVDFVVIATPNTLHYAQASACLQSGLHVVLDKPVCINVREARRLAAVAIDARRLLIPFHNRRFDGDFMTLRSLIEDGSLGQVVEIQSRIDRLRVKALDRWREQPIPGSGLLFDLGPHLLDQCLQLFGPARILGADVRAQRSNAQNDDCFSITTLHGTDARTAVRCVCSAGMLYGHAGPRFTAYGTHGTFVINGMDPQEAALRAGAKPTDDGFGTVTDEAAHGILHQSDGTRRVVATQPGAYSQFWVKACAAMRANDASIQPVTMQDAIAGLELIEHAQTMSK